MSLVRSAFTALVIAAAFIVAADCDYQWAKAKDPANPANWSRRLRDEIEAPRNEPKHQQVFVRSDLEQPSQLLRLTPDRLVNCGKDWACFEGLNDPPYVRDAMPHECNSPWGCYVDTDNRIVPRAPNDDEWIVCTTDLDCRQKHGHGMQPDIEDEEADNGQEGDSEPGEEFI